jgi:hypothetical protein
MTAMIIFILLSFRIRSNGHKTAQKTAMRPLWRVVGPEGPHPSPFKVYANFENYGKVLKINMLTDARKSILGDKRHILVNFMIKF